MTTTKGSFWDSLKSLCKEVFLFVSIVLIINVFFQFKKNKLAIQEICKTVAENYLEGFTPENFQDCLKVVSLKDFDNNKKISKFNQWFRKFHISHLYIYNAAENKKMWQGESRETGIVAKNIFGKWKVIEVLAPQSSIQIGDEILLINNKKVKSLSQITNTEGKFLIRRDSKEIFVTVQYSDIVFDERMVVKPLNSEWKYLKIPSFKSDFFGYDELARIYPEIQNKSLIIDVRDNLGGNFVSVLRFLSMLSCSEENVGKIFHHRTDFEGEKFLEDELSDYQQILQVTQSNPVFLKMFKTELCIKPGRLVVVMNEKTASVSELFVQILKNQYPKLNVFGINSAGQMVLSIWYPLKYLGPGVMISIPYAWATGNDQEIIEGLGVAPTIDVDVHKINQFTESLDPLLDYVLENERIVPEPKSRLGGISG